MHAKYIGKTGITNSNDIFNANLYIKREQTSLLSQLFTSENQWLCH